MFSDQYTYEIIDIDKDIIDRITKKLHEGEKNIQEIEENKFNPINISWVKSFSSFIQEIDPNGEQYSDTLVSEWYNARYYGGHYPKTDDEHNIVLAQYLGIIKSLINGKVKVVKEKKS